MEEFDVGALGRIEPQSEVLQVNAPSVMEPPVVEKLMVGVGDKVKAGVAVSIVDRCVAIRYADPEGHGL